IRLITSGREFERACGHVSGGRGKRREHFNGMPSFVPGKERKHRHASVDGQSDGIKLGLSARRLSFIWSGGEDAILQARLVDASLNFRLMSEGMEESGSVHDGVGEDYALERIRLARGRDRPGKSQSGLS